MSTRRALLAAGAAGAALALASVRPVAAHAIGQAFTLPVPLALYLAGAALAVAASFVISVVALRPAGPVPRYPTVAVAPGIARAASVLLQILGLGWWVGAIVIGFVVEEISPLPAVLFWIGIWVGLPISAVLLGNPWPSLSPFRTLLALLDRAARALGQDRLDLGLAYPGALARWPAVALLFGALWCELILPGTSQPRTVATLMLGYTVLTLIGAISFGRVAWLRNAELFEVLFGWFGRVGPIGRLVSVPEACAGCTEGCDPDRCMDCPECSVAADPGERAVVLRPWATGITEVLAAGWSDAAFIVLALAGVSYDGLKETAFWGSVMLPVFNALWDVLGALNTVIIVQTAGLLVVWLVFLAAFTIAAWMTRSLHDAGRRVAPLGVTAGAYAATLLPIAGGYLIAHYLTIVLQGAIWLPELIGNPVASAAPNLDFIPVSAIWYLSVAAIVVGHIIAVVLAHRLALRDAPGRAIVAGLPLVALMVSYTVFSLWIIAAPITLEPGTNPVGFLLR
jgi:hypothetical protein